MIFGMISGTLSSLFSLYIGKTRLMDTLWFDPRPGLTFVKMAVGLWAAFLGVLAVATEAIVGIYTSIGSVILLAMIFGYSQQAVTAFMDRKVASMLSEEDDEDGWQVGQQVASRLQGVTPGVAVGLLARCTTR